MGLITLWQLGSYTENIELIEKNTTENLKHTLKDSIYDNKSIFRFLPGHKVSVLVLPELVDQYNFSTQVPPSNVIKSARAASSASNSEKNIEYIEILSEEEKTKLTESMIQKIVKYSVKIGLDGFILSVEDVSSIDSCINRAGTVTYKCFVECPSCGLRIPCLFNKNWKISNLEKHLKDNHANKKIPSENQSKSSNDHVVNITEGNGANFVHLPISSNEHELSSLLNSESDGIQRSNEIGENEIEKPIYIS